MFSIKEIEVGRNFIKLEIEDDNNQLIEFDFFQVKKELIIETLKIYGIDITEEIQDYDDYIYY